MAKKKVDEEAEMFKNLSSDTKVVYGAECSKQQIKRSNNKRLKKEQEKYATSTEEGVRAPIEKEEEGLKKESTEEKEVVEFSGVNEIIETNKESLIEEETIIHEEEVTTENSVSEEIIETTENVNETQQTVENNKTEKPKTKKLPYDVKHMFGYNWLGVVYDE